jgi:hypothetical protein
MMMFPNSFKKAFLYSLAIVLTALGLLSYGSLPFPLNLYGLLTASTGVYSFYLGYKVQ